MKFIIKKQFIFSEKKILSPIVAMIVLGYALLFQRCVLLIFALSQLAPIGITVKIEEIKTDKESNAVIQHENIFIDAEKLRAFIFSAMKGEERKISHKASDVEISLLASLFPELSEKKQETQQLEDRIKEIFKEGFFDKALPQIILSRIDQLARESPSNDDKKEMLKGEEQCAICLDVLTIGAAQKTESLQLHPCRADRAQYLSKMQEHSGKISSGSSVDDSSSPNVKTFHHVQDQLAVLERKIDRQLRLHHRDSLYRFLHDYAGNKHRRMSADPRFVGLNTVTKVRMFFYRWLFSLTGHLDSFGTKRAELYTTDEPKACESGQAFQLYLAEWLQYAVLTPLVQRIVVDLIDHEPSNSDVLLTFCVHMSLRVFLDYADRLHIDRHFQLDEWIILGMNAYRVESELRKVTKKLARQGKTATKLVKPIRDHIFVNLPLPDESPKRLSIEHALQTAVNGLEEAADKSGDPKVLFQFFVRFYRELAPHSMAHWLQWLEEVIQHENIFIDAENLRTFIVGAMKGDFKERKISHKARDVEIGLLSSLFPEPAEKKKQETQQLEDRIKEIFKEGLFDKALPQMILNRIDQLAQRFHLESLTKVDETHKEKIHSIGKNITADADGGRMDELTMAKLANKIDKQLRKNRNNYYYIDKERNYEKFFFYFRNNVVERYRRISSDSRFNHLKIVNKVRLFFYSWFYSMVGHLDDCGEERINLYRAMPTYQHEPGQAFQLYLAEWLQNVVLPPLGQRIMLDMIDQLQKGSWDVLVPFCVHLSLRDFLNYRERLDWDNLFHMDQLIESRLPAFYMVEYYVRDVTETLAKQRKTANELVKMISYQIFTNLPLPDGSPIRLSIEQALQAAANGLGKAANKQSDTKVLFQFFISFYRELIPLASLKWQQMLAEKNIKTSMYYG